MNYLSLIDRTSELLEEDISEHSKYLHGIISKSSFLVIGGAGSIGQSVVKEIFKEIQSYFMLLIYQRTIWLSL